MPRAPQSLDLIAEVASLGPATEFVRRGAREAELPEGRIAELDLLVEEILMNLSRYAYPQDFRGVMTITYSVPAPGELRVEFADQGREFDPLSASPPNLNLDLRGRPIGGLGVYLMKSFAESLSYRREDGWNRLSFGICAGPASAGS